MSVDAREIPEYVLASSANSVDLVYLGVCDGNSTVIPSSLLLDASMGDSSDFAGNCGGLSGSE